MFASVTKEGARKLTVLLSDCVTSESDSPVNEMYPFECSLFTLSVSRQKCCSVLLRTFLTNYIT